MPNHITNILLADAEVLSALKGEESPVDFDRVIPKPDGFGDMDGVSGRAEALAELITGKLENKADDLLSSLRMRNVKRDLLDGGIALMGDDEFAEFVTMLRNFRLCGYFSWLDWNRDKWGTKWNAYEVAEVAGGVQFDTAWSAPHPVVGALAERFPDHKIHHKWADEDIGHNLGERVYRLGGMTELPQPEDPVDFALTLTGHDREYYWENPDTGKWEYRSEE